MKAMYRYFPYLARPPEHIKANIPQIIKIGNANDTKPQTAIATNRIGPAIRNNTIFDNPQAASTAIAINLKTKQSMQIANINVNISATSHSKY